MKASTNKLRHAAQTPNKLSPRLELTKLSRGPDPEMMTRLSSRPDLQDKIRELQRRNLVNPFGARRVAGLFSGGIDTSFVCLILARFFGVQVYALTLDFGTIAGSSSSARMAGTVCENLRALGAAEAKFMDLREKLGWHFLPLLMGDVIVPGSPGVFPNSSITRILMVEALAGSMSDVEVYLTGSAANQNNNLRFMTACLSIPQ